MLLHAPFKISNASSVVLGLPDLPVACFFRTTICASPGPPMYGPTPSKRKRPVAADLPNQQLASGAVVFSSSKPQTRGDGP
jgi:hypothetical protein